MGSPAQSRTESRGFYASSGFLQGSSQATAFASSSSIFSRQSSNLKARDVTPPRVKTYVGSAQSSQSFRFSNDRLKTPSSSILISKSGGGRQASSACKKTCMCAPTTHPGSFRCSMHRKAAAGANHHSASYNSSRSLNFLRSAMTNSLVRISGVEGDLVKRALSSLIRPSSNQIHRRLDFQPKPTRFRISFLKDQEQNSRPTLEVK